MPSKRPLLAQCVKHPLPGPIILGGIDCIGVAEAVAALQSTAAREGSPPR
jgi:hypothetical protein